MSKEESLTVATRASLYFQFSLVPSRSIRVRLVFNEVATNLCKSLESGVVLKRGILFRAAHIFYCAFKTCSGRVLRRFGGVAATVAIRVAKVADRRNHPA